MTMSARKKWWARQDLNPQPIGYEPTALPLSYRPSSDQRRWRLGSVSNVPSDTPNLIHCRNHNTIALSFANGWV